MDIQINVKEKRASVSGAPVIICDNSDYTVTFTLDDEWEGTGTKTARFVYIQAGEVKYQDVVFEGAQVAVPKLKDTKEVRIGVFAGDLKTSTHAVIPCQLSIRSGTGTPDDPTPSQYDQIMALLSGNAGTELPAVTAEDAGKVLQVDENGKWVPGVVGEEGENPTVTTIDASQWDSGTLSIHYADNTTDNLPVVFDDNGVPTSIGGVTLVFPEVE